GLQGFEGVHAYERDDDACASFLTVALSMTEAGSRRWEARGGLRGGWYQIDPAPQVKRRFGGGVVQHVAWGCVPDELEAWRGRRARGRAGAFAAGRRPRQLTGAWRALRSTGARSGSASPNAPRSRTPMAGPRGRCSSSATSWSPAVFPRTPRSCSRIRSAAA